MTLEQELELKTFRTAYLYQRKNDLTKFGKDHVAALEAIVDPIPFFLYIYEHEDVEIHYFPEPITDALGI